MLVVRRGVQQAAGGGKIAADRPVGGVEFRIDDRSLAAQPGPVGAVLAVAFNCEDRVDPMRLAQQEVVLAVVGGHVDQARAAVGGDEVRAVEERAGLGEEAA